MAKKPLYKRIKYGNVAMLIIVIAFVVLMVSVIKKSTDNNDDSSSSLATSDTSSDIQNDDGSGQSPNVSQTSDSVLSKIDFTYVKFTSEAIHNGSLVVVGPGSTFSGNAPSDCVSCYDYMFDSSGNKLFSIRNNEVKASAQALESVRKMMTDFAALYGQASMVLMNGYESTNAADELCTGSSVLFRFLNSDGTYSDFNPIGSYQWIAENAYHYGLIIRYPGSKSEITGVSDKTGYIRYVGQPHAQIMHNNDLCLEEYIEVVKKHSYENAIGYTTDDGRNYAVYYAASEGSETNIKLPTDSYGDLYKYEVSGNNTDGYIITVRLD